MKAYEKDQKQSTGEASAKRKADHDDQVTSPAPYTRETGYDPEQVTSPNPFVWGPGCGVVTGDELRNEQVRVHNLAPIRLRALTPE